MDILNIIYGKNADIPAKKLRINKLKQKFLKSFNIKNADIFSSSGRIEILGNHTDHNHGNVLVGAISQDIVAASAKREDGKIIIKSEGFEDIEFNASDTEKKESEKGKSISLLKGIIKALTDKGYKIGGISAMLTSNIFKGAGVSSSAAYEVLFCKILSCYYCNDSISPLDNAKISQFAESVYFGKPCGLLDQSGISFGGVNHIDFSDITSPKITTITPDFTGYSIVITNSGGDHSNLTPEYAAVKEDMHSISKFFGKEYLREVPYEKFCLAIPELKNELGGRAILRAFHFYHENLRVDSAAESLKNSDMQKFLLNVNLSGESSYKLLQNCYLGGDKYQGIPLALEISKQLLCGKGAVRVHGGGFAGTIIAFVPQDMTLNYIKNMQKIFGNENVIEVSLRNTGAALIKI